MTAGAAANESAPSEERREVDEPWEGRDDDACESTPDEEGAGSGLSLAYTLTPRPALPLVAPSVAVAEMRVPASHGDNAQVGEAWAVEVGKLLRARPLGPWPLVGERTATDTAQAVVGLQGGEKMG